ncbi:uncharacterized protein si:ch73-242m19.1 isoform X2 [Betta splendens]|uniref:Uncharacterized protein si:ch73-242m19.1 isoform X2 n=1 Tax=Betta splendens TaxID=158456 RepID=A0A9W2XJL4_BETSP|nr:uncharacterized protein si:ch73-242m19.1 isoform X2 [Betta splendens]
MASEHEDAVQRARRLSTSREKLLSGRGSGADQLTEADVALYLRWLVCHLHSLQTVHSFLRVLHYIPAGERKDEDSLPTVMKETSPQPQRGLADDVPFHAVHLEEFLPELTSLIAFFHLPYDVTRLRTSADEMELFSVVWREFRAIFRQQEQMKTFPPRDGTESKEAQWGRTSPSMAVKAEASWIPFIQVKPRRDPWQQKLIVRLKEQKCVDELLKLHCGFTQAPQLMRVAAVLKERAARVAGSQAAPDAPSTKRRNASEIWTGVYGAASSTQEVRDQSAAPRDRGGWDKRSTRSQTSAATSKSYSLEASLHLLGLDDSLEEGTVDPTVTTGAYLSLTYLRHLKLRQLQRISLGLLNYLRSVERTLTFDLAGLKLQEQELCSSAEESGWMNAARGGRGEAGGLGSLQYSHNTPVDYRVHCSEFMEFPEVENLHDFYSSEEQLIHTQDHRGFYIVYDAALQDLEGLRSELLLVGSHFIQRSAIATIGKPESAMAAEIDRVAVLLDLWTCEAEFLESKVQLLNCYYEAYQHTAGAEERFTLAGVITDIMHSRPQLDLHQDYFVGAYRAEISCLQSHRQLIKGILDKQIEQQRRYLQRIWRDDSKGSIQHYGLPPNYVPKHLVSLGGSSPALTSVFLLELHPSLRLASAVYHGLAQAHAQLCQLHRATGVSEKLTLRQKLLQRALHSWSSLAPLGSSYSSQVQKDLFSDLFIEDPFLVQKVGLTSASAEEEDVKRGNEARAPAVRALSRLLELVTVRHRLLESASETAHLAQLYRSVASELGFGEFHLHMRPVPFDAAEQRTQAERSPAFFTAVQEEDSSVDRFAPSHLPLSVQELDEEQIGRFSFSSEEAVVHLMNEQSVQNLRVTLACQVAQKNALISAVKLASLCYWAGSVDAAFPTSTKERLSEAFLSVQLEKVGVRDEMLDSFMEKRRVLKTPEEAAEVKRRVIIEFAKKLTTRVSLHCVRAQIVAYHYSLMSLLDRVPSIRQSHFVVGRAGTTTDAPDSGAEPNARTFQRRPQQLVSDDGRTLLNLWFIPHFSQVLRMFKTQDASACAEALHHTLLIVSGLHDIVHYLVSFSRLGNTESCYGCRSRQRAPCSHPAADWGGSEGIGAELLELRRQVDGLSNPGSPESVGRLLQLRRQVLLLQFDTAVRHLIRDAFLASGDFASYRSVSDNLATALPLLSDSIQTDMQALPVPQPLEAQGCQAQTLYPWRSFAACHGLLPLQVWDIPPIEYCMQLCLCGLSDRTRLQANAAILGVSLLMEDVLNSGKDAAPVCLRGNKQELLHDVKSDEDPVRIQTVLKGFLLLTKQLQVFKENWARRSLGVDVFTVPSLYQQFVKLYRAEIFLPSMKALARQMSKEKDYDMLISGSQSLLPPPGASDVDVKTWQLHKLLESAECDMIREVQRRISRELTLAVAERTRQDARLPTELWKKAQLKFSVSLERPQMVETFIQQLMEGADEAEGQERNEELRVSRDHLQQCLTRLGSAVMERERRGFLLYSQFYEQILQQETQLLREKERDLKDLRDSRAQNSQTEASGWCRGMMLQISALQAQVAQLQEEKRSLEEQLGLRFKERYDPLVRQLFATCIQMKGRLDVHHQQMEQDVGEMVNRIRAQGVDRIMRLKKKYGCTTDNDGLMLTQLKKEEIYELNLENGRLSALLCKLKALRRWRQVVDEGKLHRQLLQAQQREITSRTDALRVKMMSEEKVVFLQEELDVVRQMLSHCQAECSGMKTLLSRKTEELQVVRHQSAQEARSRQELDSYRLQSLEQMRADVEDRDRQLRALGEQLDRGSRMQQLQRQRSAKEIRQVRGRLHQERSLKQEAFQQVDKLKTQVNDMEAAVSRCTTTPGPSRAYCTLSVSRLSIRSPSAGLRRASRQPSALQLGSVSNHGAAQELASEPRPQGAETAGGRLSARLDRAKAASELPAQGPGSTKDPSRLRVLATETLLPNL